MNKIKHFIGSIKIEDLVMLLVFLLSIIFIVIKASLSSAAGRAPYESWAYSVKIKVTNPGQPRTDYCVRLEIPTTPYIDSGRMNSDLRDIRFSQSGIALPFWIHITESMNRNSYSIPIYVKIKTLNTGDNYIYMHFDKNRQATDSPPSGGTSYLCANPGTGVNFTSASCAHSCVGSPVTTFPFSGKNAGASAFSIFAYDSRDTDTWNRIGTFRDTNERWINKTRLSNSFIFHFRTHLYLPNEAMPYFLLQGTTPPLPANIDSTNGYRLYIDYDATVSDNYHYNRGRYYLKLFRRTAAGETQVAISQPLYIYNNTIWDWDILVSTSTVKVVTNGIEVLSYTRSGETFNGGYVGFKRLPIAGGECAGNSTDGISPIWAIDKY
ncbi:hypothetical protein KKG61_06765, partial [bacterium]|nr:hypothetical protein [bacterium]